MNTQIIYWLEENMDTLKKNKETAQKICKNLEHYVTNINIEAQAGFFGMVSEATNKGKDWPRVVMGANKNIGNKFIATIRGKSSK